VGGVKSPLNLATRPARNERLPALLFAVAALLLGGLTVRHGFLVADLASAAATNLDDEVARLEREGRELKERERTLRATRVDPLTLARWAFLKDLVDRRAFSWTGLLARLEAALPPDVRIEAISPDVKEARFRLGLDAVARDATDAVALVKALEDRPEFEQVFLLSLSEAKEGARCRYQMLYLPAAEPQAPPPTSAETSDVPEEAGP
jgi:hypothetical protein